MKRTPARSLQALVRSLGFDVVRYAPKAPGHELLHAIDTFATLRELAFSGRDEEEIRFLEFCGSRFRKSRAQLFQDLFVQFELNERHGGYFVEFGAADGIHLSNSYSLEREYGWSGVLSEPAHCWHLALKANRKCRLDLRCVWDTSGESLDFSEVEAAELSTASTFVGAEGELHAASRRHAQVYKVDTVSLNDMLRDCAAPVEIDYLSIDTEGSEFKILSAFNFNLHRVKIITVEHNFGSDRERIHDMLVRHGFRRKFQVFSRWDDWYVAT